MPDELVIPVPIYEPNAACKSLRGSQKVKYDLKALDTESLPSWAKYSDAGKSIHFSAQKDSSLAGQSHRFALEGSFDENVTIVASFIVYFHGPDQFAKYSTS